MEKVKFLKKVKRRVEAQSRLGNLHLNAREA